MDADERGYWLPESVGVISDQDQSRFKDRIANAVQSMVGGRLVGIRYRCLRGEASGESILLPEFYLGGEVELVLDEGRGSRYISWDERAGWAEHFSVVVADHSLWPESAVTVFEAADVPVWKPALGDIVERVSVFGGVFGYDMTPYVVVLCFANSAIALGSAYQTEFGDGDDVFIDRYDPASVSLRRLVEIWRCE